MRKLRALISLLLIAGIVGFIYSDDYQENGINGVWQQLTTDVDNIKNNPQLLSTIETMKYKLEDVFERLTESNTEPPVPSDAEKPELTAPSEQSFSIHNIELSQSKASVTEQLGEAKRQSLNEYGVDWYSYHDNFQNFLMVAYNEQDQVAALYTNQDLISSTKNITLSSNKTDVRDAFGEPLDSIRKGFTRYKINDSEEQDTFLIDESYVTFFYDVHQGNQLAAIQIVAKSLENQKQDFFGGTGDSLKEGFEYQLFDLTNASRVKFGLPVLQWYEEARTTAQNHSTDMAENNYFGHNNLDGQSPFDRLKEDGISFQLAGENLAAGQASSIFAHQGLMNSEGHRKNILHADFRLMSVGVAMKEDGQPFYTESFITK
ncbi:CAP domain-containing protein [Gracilibacillus caseinilyticus]|uniref:CAP domain-containing protein n=1 Tax=Gracilibacillus caseinilyticus TaxID=2932256 RepID=A0ABY4EUV2_9BACI|nr:CAP domain-containing protein [Gracilibacillus caseinilyticus]UOQ47658.1 CAP domain-containing protein [Gracilibacillus caseinilyticus]